MQIAKNNFLDDGVCRYIDRYNNTAFLKRTDKGFVAKLRFNNKAVSSKPLYVDIPVPNNYKGIDLNLNYRNSEELLKDDIQEGVRGFSVVVNRWIDMITAIKQLQIPADMIKNLGISASDEEIAKVKLNNISGFEELSGLAKWMR